MSNYHYFLCVAHDPPLLSDTEFTQHYNDAAYKEGVALAKNRPVGDPEWEQSYDYFAANARRFLLDHPHCELRIKDEYGEIRTLDGKPLTNSDGGPLIDPFSEEKAMEDWDKHFVMLDFMNLGPRPNFDALWRGKTSDG